MKGKFCFFVILLQMLSLVSATSRPFPPNYAHAAPPQPGTKKSTQSVFKTMEGVSEMKEDVSKIGSSPPRCEHKCYGCTPCEAIQVPTTSRKSSHNLGVQYANYEPEGWKCKCGPSFYSP